MSRTILALCDHAAQPCILAELETRDGVQGISFLAAVGGLSLRSDIRRGTGNLDASPGWIPLDSDMAAGAWAAYCKRHRREYFLLPGQLLRNHEAGNPPMKLDPTPRH